MGSEKITTRHAHRGHQDQNPWHVTRTRTHVWSYHTLQKDRAQKSRCSRKKKPLPCTVLEWVLRSYFSWVLGSCEVPSYLVRQFRAQVQSLHCTNLGISASVRRAVFGCVHDVADRFTHVAALPQLRLYRCCGGEDVRSRLCATLR